MNGSCASRECKPGWKQTSDLRCDQCKCLMFSISWWFETKYWFLIDISIQLNIPRVGEYFAKTDSLKIEVCCQYFIMLQYHHYLYLVVMIYTRKQRVVQVLQTSRYDTAIICCWLLFNLHTYNANGTSFTGILLISNDCNIQCYISGYWYQCWVCMCGDQY